MDRLDWMWALLSTLVQVVFAVLGIFIATAAWQSIDLATAGSLNAQANAIQAINNTSAQNDATKAAQSDPTKTSQTEAAAASQKSDLIKAAQSTGTMVPSQINSTAPSPTYQLWWMTFKSPALCYVYLAVGAAIIGSVVHGLGALFTRCGTRSFDRAWVPYYLLDPLSAAGLAAGMLWIIRGSLMPAGSSFSSASPDGVAGMAFLVGLFSKNAVAKLQSVAENIFSVTKPTGTNPNPDHAPDANAPPVVPPDNPPPG